MTQPATPSPLPQPDTGTNTPGQPERNLGSRGAGLRRASAVVSFGVPVGLLWWVLAPSGLNVLTGDPALNSAGNPDTWLPRDLVLAGLFLLAGCISGMLASGRKDQEPSSEDVLLMVAAGALGGLLAWGTGVLCGLWLGTPAEPPTGADLAFSLRSYPVLVIWPAAVALSIFLAAFFAAPRRPASGEPGA